MKTGNLLIEVGCEDLPSWAGEHFVNRFRPLFLNELKANKLEPGDIMFFFTPRRFVILVKNLPSETPAERKMVMGPKYENAFDEKGHPTAAALGFARAHNVQVSSLKIRDSNGKKVVCTEKIIPGVSSNSVVSEIFPSILRKIDIPRGMRWNESEDIFYRPVRWILAFFGKEIVNIEFGGAKSSRYTFGHRTLNPKRIKVLDWKDYFDKVQKAFVVLGEDLREKFIFGLLEKTIKKGEDFEKSAAKNLINLIEYPCIIRCKFPDIDCKLPEDVLRVLIEKAKGIPIFYDGHLKKEFFVVSDGNSNTIVQENYENLLKTRILDAQFFFDSDLAISFDDMGKRLSRIVFHQRWGSLAQKVDRLKSISNKIYDLLGLEPSRKHILVEAAHFCKFDLASEMVREFPELHGIMGAIYAGHAGKDESICRVIAQYKYPVYPDDPLPEDECAIVLGIIDRLDFICGFITAGGDVSGSEDPYGLRRTASGFFSLVQRLGVEADYSDVVRKVLESYGIIGSEMQLSKVRVNELLMQRFEAYLESGGFPKGLRTSVISIDGMNFVRVWKKLNALKDFIKTRADAETILVPVTRIANILKQAKERNIEISEFNHGLLKESGERNLAEFYMDFSDRAKDVFGRADYTGFLKLLIELRDPVDEFFDSTLVMCPEEDLKNNRLALLNKFNSIFTEFADFSYIREEDIKNVRKG